MLAKILRNNVYKGVDPNVIPLPLMIRLIDCAIDGKSVLKLDDIPYSEHLEKVLEKEGFKCEHKVDKEGIPLWFTEISFKEEIIEKAWVIM
jgi:hypothetical protein